MRTGFGLEVIITPLAIAFPQIDPVLIQLGPFAIRWYALAYIAGLVIGWQLLRALGDGKRFALTKDQIDDLLFYATLGIIFGGRLGYVLFYQPGHYLSHPVQILAVWQGGMSFHGGLIGVAVAIILFARKANIPMLEIGDAVATMAPIGLFFGRIANFINGELFGRVSDVPWAMVFPNGGPLPRHPSQLYEAALEGLVLGIVLLWLVRSRKPKHQMGLMVGYFLAGYGLARTIVEFFREPDAHLGFIFNFVTMGQLLSLPMIILGLALIMYSRNQTARTNSKTNQ